MQGTYETFVEIGRRHYGGSLAGRWILTAGLGGMGGAQPLAATMAGASMLAVECQPSRIEMRLRTGYLDVQARDLDEALAMIERSCRGEEAALGGLARQRRRRVPRAGAARRQARRRDRPDLGARSGQRLSAEGLDARRVGGAGASAIRKASSAPPSASMAEHVRAMLEFQQARRPDLRLRQQHPPDGARTRASTTPSTFPGFVPAYIRPLFCRGIGPFRWVALSGDPEDIYRTDAKVKELMPDDAHLHHWLDMAQRAHHVPGPAGAHLLGRASATATGSASPSTRWWRAAS